MMYGVNDTPNLHFATTAGKIGNGLDEQLENFMQEYPDTKLIIIDTMQKIREVSGEAWSTRTFHRMCSCWWMRATDPTMACWLRK